MKAAFVGKGGSGKTTISALFTRYIASKGFPVIAIDADINQHLLEALGIPPHETNRMKHIGTDIGFIKEYVRHNNQRISSTEAMIKTTPPGDGSRLLTVTQVNPVYDRFALTFNGIRAMATGPYSSEDLGVKCFHSKTGAVELFLNHLVDKEKEYVIVDMTAGADSFASGLFTKFDVTFIVVEPTLKSLTVYDQYKHYAADYDVTLKPIANKITNIEDINFIKSRTGEAKLTVLGLSPYVQRMEKGIYGELSELENNNVDALEEMLCYIDTRQKDWSKFYKQAIEFHIRNADSWASAQLGIDLTQQIDESFNLELAAQQLKEITYVA